jgi:hypothetical protein
MENIREIGRYNFAFVFGRELGLKKGIKGKRREELTGLIWLQGGSNGGNLFDAVIKFRVL